MSASVDILFFPIENPLNNQEIMPSFETVGFVIYIFEGDSHEAK